MKHVMFVVALVAGLLVVIGAASADLPPGGSFDDDNGNVHEANIEAIAAAGITRGCNPPTNDLYCPDERVTRGQMAAFLVRALDLTDDGGGNTFVDDDGSTFEDDIAKLAAAGITKGCNPPANDMYCPDSSVSRGQMAAFLVRALDLTDDGGGNTFVDDDGSIFEDDIAKLAAAGITLGCNPPTNDMYCPADPVHRDQMASFLARALDLDPITPPPPASSTTTTSSTTSTTQPGTSGGTFTGPLQSVPGLTGTITFEATAGNGEVSDPTLDLVLDAYDCGGGLTVWSVGTSTFFLTEPVTGGSFAHHGIVDWAGTFNSPSQASGTISGDYLLDPNCDGGTLTWTATN